MPGVTIESGWNMARNGLDSGWIKVTILVSVTRNGTGKFLEIS